MTPEPIVIDCEGSGVPTSHHLCTMCGWVVPNPPEVPPHQRNDLIAMLERGDFDEQTGEPK